MKGEDFIRALREVRFLTEGWRGRIFFGKLIQGNSSTEIAVKIARKPELIKNIKKEAYILRKVNQYGIGPELILEGEDFIATRFVEGQSFDKILSSGAKNEIAELIIDILLQARKLDEIGISKDEMHRPSKNIIVAKEDRKPVLLDFESANETAKPKNVTQFVSFILSMMRLSGKIGKREDEKAIELMKKYKKSYSDREFSEILSFIKDKLEEDK